MPDPRQMSGIPRPVTDLPNGSVSVRVIRGQLSNNLSNQDVELRVGSTVMKAKTDAAGRAQFDRLPAGTTVKAMADVDGEHLESQEFPAPGQGGIRLLLVATDSKAAAAAGAEAVAGTVTIGGTSRIVLEPGDESVQIYYLLDLVNSGQAPVNTASLFTFDMPTGSAGCGLLEGSTPQASVKGTRVSVEGPFPPGPTTLHVACDLPTNGASLDISQKFPAGFQRVALIVKKIGAMAVTSPQIEKQQDMSAQGETYLVASGPPLQAGQNLSLSLTDLPHHSSAPRWTALLLAAAIIVCGVWASTRAPEQAAAMRDERTRLIARRARLFDDLVRLEHERRNGRVDERNYGTRREELVAALEHVYGALDDDTGPEPLGRAGVAA
jgi:hypothetical protein